jgi:outer membrane immunogenic protein
MMKFSALALGLVSALAVSTTSFAADIPARVVKGGVAPASTCLWAGPYLGAHVGYTWAKTSNNSIGLNNLPIGTLDNSNVSGGLYAGYNFCATPGLIFGLEADITKLGHKANFSQIVAGNGFGVGYDANWGGSVRARVGLPFDRFLVYVTGGVAGVQENAYAILTTPAGAVSGVRKSSFSVGYTAGVGAEYAFTKNIIGRAEYLYTDPGRFSVGGGRFNSNFHTVRVGVAYKF